MLTIDTIKGLEHEFRNFVITIVNLKSTYLPRIVEVKDYVLLELQLNNKKDFIRNISTYIYLFDYYIHTIEMQFPDSALDYLNKEYLDIWCLLIFCTCSKLSICGTPIYQSQVIKDLLDKFEKVLNTLKVKLGKEAYELERYQKYLDFIQWEYAYKYSSFMSNTLTCGARLTIAGVGQIKSSEKDVAECELDLYHNG